MLIDIHLMCQHIRRLIKTVAYGFVGWFHGQNRIKSKQYAEKCVKFFRGFRVIPDVS